jgi:glutaredoxin-like YruB-family protein
MPDVKVYSTPSCPWCVKLKNYLKEKSIAFIDFDVSEDENALREMVGKSGQMGVPQIEINKKIIVGFDKEAIDAELRKQQMKKIADKKS